MGGFSDLTTKSYLFSTSVGKIISSPFIFLLYTNHKFFNSNSSLASKSFGFNSMPSFDFPNVC